MGRRQDKALLGLFGLMVLVALVAQWWPVLLAGVALVGVAAATTKSGGGVPARREDPSRAQTQPAEKPRPLRAPSLSDARRMVREAIDRWDSLGEGDIAAMEFALTAAATVSEDVRQERYLLYALRVSRNVPTFRTMKTLGSRWQTASYGRETGFQFAFDSPNQERVVAFLSGLYERRLAEVLDAELEGVSRHAARLKTQKAREGAYQRFVTRLETLQQPSVGGDVLFVPGFDFHRDRVLRETEKRFAALRGASSPRAGRS